MTAISETSQDYQKASALRASLNEASVVNRSGRVLLGSALLISVVGLWVIPVEDGDSAMRLIKLLISVVLGALGAMFIGSASDNDALPEIQIDPGRGELRVVRNGEVKAHRLDELTDVVLKDDLMTARSSTGELVLSLPISDHNTKRALRAALDLAA